MGPIEVAVIGAGNRGKDVYAAYALRNPHEVRVVAVAERDGATRQQFAEQHGLSASRCFADWRELLDGTRICDAVLICTGDQDHVEPALRAIDLGYHILLEKPMAAEPSECLSIAHAAEQAGVILVVAHVLRYAPFFQTIRRLLDERAIGRLVSIQHNENVGYFHFAHSYVRGNWRRRDEASPIILAKSCHDMDLLYWFAGATCEQVASFGSLTHFRPENAPEGHTDRCLDGCPHIHTCPFSVNKVYLSRPYEWPTTVVTSDSSLEGRLEALRSGPYGRCVYECDNDVVDNQVASLVFSNGVTASFVLSGFTHDISRSLKLMGTEGEIRAHLEKNEIAVHSFSDDSVQQLVPGRSNSGHGGGDGGLMQSFVSAIRSGDHANVFSARESAEGHLIAFAAEAARTSNRVVRMADFVSGIEVVQ